MRIAYVITSSDSIGGAQVHVRDLSSALLAIGHEVTVLVGGEGPFTEELHALGIPYRGLCHLHRSIHLYHDWLGVKEISAVLKDWHPDLISTHSSKAGLLGRIAGKTMGIPTIFTAHGWAFTDGIPDVERKVYMVAEKLAAPLASRIITVSDYDRNLALRYHLAPEGRLIVIHNGMPDVSPSLRAKPGYNPPRLLMVARFEPQKDHATLFKALQQLHEFDWEIDLVGSGSLGSEVGEMASRLELTRRIRFLGARKDVAELLAQAQVFLLISKWEGFPRSILEAMRAGLPVIASEVGGVREAIVEGKTGFLVPRGGVELLAQRLRLLLTNPELRIRMGQEARKRYESQFTFERMFRETFTVYQSVLD